MTNSPARWSARTARVTSNQEGRANRGQASEIGLAYLAFHDNGARRRHIGSAELLRKPMKQEGDAQNRHTELSIRKGSPTVACISGSVAALDGDVFIATQKPG